MIFNSVCYLFQIYNSSKIANFVPLSFKFTAGSMTASMTSSMSESRPPPSTKPQTAARAETKKSSESDIAPSPQLHADTDIYKSGIDEPKELEINNQLTDNKLCNILSEEEAEKIKSKYHIKPP